LQALLERHQRIGEMPANDIGCEQEFTEDPNIPIGAWVRVKDRSCPSFVGFTYVDPQAGLSARGSAQTDPKLADAPFITVRLLTHSGNCPWAWRKLSRQEIQRMGLPDKPPWATDH